MGAELLLEPGVETWGSQTPRALGQLPVPQAAALEAEHCQAAGLAVSWQCSAAIKPSPLNISMSQHIPMEKCLV